MKNWNTIKTASAILLLNGLENALLLLLFGVQFNLQTLIGIGIFTIALTLLLKLFNVIKEN